MEGIEFLQKSPGENNRRYAYRALFHAIMNLDIKPGQQISDSELAVALGVSRTPVREAMLQLMDVNLVDVHPQRSSRVSQIDLELVEEGVFLRNALETDIIKAAIDTATPPDFAAIRENMSLQRLRLEERRFQEYVQLDDEFHRLLFAAAKKPGLWRLVVSVTTHLNRLRLLQRFAGIETLTAGCDEHYHIYDIISRHKPVELSAFIHRHLTAGYRSALPYIQEAFPEYIKR